MIALVGHEHLALVRQPAKRGGMDDAVAVALELAARGRGRLRQQPPTAQRGVGGVGGDKPAARKFCGM